MRSVMVILIISAILVAGLVAVLGQMLFDPAQPLIVHASFDREVISPNADGVDDLAVYRYELSDNALVSIVFTHEDGRSFAFRKDEPRAKGVYEGLFSGVVDGYLNPSETVGGEVIRRLMPIGNYTWVLSASHATRDETQTIEGKLSLEDADAQLPDISVFSVSPLVFSPNQDGIDDRVQFNVVLEKDAALDVYLVGTDDVQIFIPPRQDETREGEAGRYTYDYDGGVDTGANPPPDGTYTVYAVAQDAVGQRVLRTAELSLVTGGKPFAEIVSQTSGADVAFAVIPDRDEYISNTDEYGAPVPQPTSADLFAQNDITMQVGDILLFMLTIENYGDVPIRTHGAPPGTVYAQNQRAAVFGDLDESGAWRVGIDCDTATSDYPWRWAIGDASVLESVYDEATDNTYFYLPAGERAVVWGGIRMTDVIAARNPQNCWAGLIHEDVAVSVRNARVGARSIELIDPQQALNTVDDGNG